MARGTKIRRHKKSNVTRSSKNRLRTKIRREEIGREWEKGSLTNNYKQLGLALDVNSIKGIKKMSAATREAIKSGAEPEEASEIAKNIVLQDTDEAAVGQQNTTHQSAEATSAVRASKRALVNKWGKIDQNTALTGHGTTAARKPKFWLSEEDRAYIKPLHDRYGNDYSAMARDIKLNNFQQTKGWLARNVERYVNFVKEHGQE